MADEYLIKLARTATSDEDFSNLVRECERRGITARHIAGSDTPRQVTEPPPRIVGSVVSVVANLTDDLIAVRIPLSAGIHGTLVLTPGRTASMGMDLGIVPAIRKLVYEGKVRLTVWDPQGALRIPMGAPLTRELWERYERATRPAFLYRDFDPVDTDE